MWTKTFWKRVVERAIRATATASVTAIGTTAAIQDVDWAVVGGAAGIAAVVSFLGSVASSRVGDRESTSVVK